ncbi:hypothetical protein [Bacillus smithii]|uniref:hypothetical protein n=1 Tax=Bacillus smithii TaxID=1479 RepID=UPI003D245119
MFFDKDRIRDSLTLDDIKKILINELGSNEPNKDNQGNLIFQTVCHAGEKHKLYYYEDSKQFHCYTDCGDSFDIFELVIRAKKHQGETFSFPKAVKYVARLTGKTFGTGFPSNQQNNEIITDWEWINKFEKKEKINIELPEYDERLLDVLLPYPHINWIEEGISYETQKKFEIGYYMREERIAIVHRDIKGRFIGLRGRATRQEDIDNGKKYMPVTINGKLLNHPTMMNFFGIDKTKEAIKRLKKAAIFEAEKSVLKCEDFYGENNFSVACCGSNVSTFQRDILLSLGVEEVFICLDKFRDKKPDETGEEYEEKIIDYQEKLLNIARMFSPYVRSYIIWDFEGLLDFKDSPVDKGKEVLEELMRNKIEVNTLGVE